MRLWHQTLIPKLPRQQLLGQHRECCALRGLGWGKPHSVVNYVFKYSREKLEDYHALVMQEMENRGYKVTEQWWLRNYRGKRLSCTSLMLNSIAVPKLLVYPEHNDAYLKECVDNLHRKGVILNVCL